MTAANKTSIEKNPGNRLPLPSIEKGRHLRIILFNQPLLYKTNFCCVIRSVIYFQIIFIILHNNGRNSCVQRHCWSREEFQVHCPLLLRNFYRDFRNGKGVWYGQVPFFSTEYIRQSFSVQLSLPIDPPSILKRTFEIRTEFNYRADGKGISSCKRHPKKLHNFLLRLLSNRIWYG